MSNAWEKVQLSRRADRPTAQFYINSIFDDFLELHGDRNYSDDKAIIGGIATLNGIAVTVIGQEKGNTMEEKVLRNFGSTNPEGFRKALRLMKQSEKFKRPIICFVDTQGAFCGIGAEERGQGEAIARNLQEMMALTVPVFSVVIGEGGSGGALALAVANEVYMLKNAVYSILSPEGFSSILWKDSSRKAEAAEVMKITADDLKELKIIEQIIDEPEEGAQENADYCAANIKALLSEKLIEYSNYKTDQIVSSRFNRFRKF